MKFPPELWLLDLVRRRVFGLIVASIVLGLACRAVQYQLSRNTAGAGGLSTYVGCESLILLAPLVFSVALMSSFGVRRREVISVPVQVVAGTWTVWAIAMVFGLSCGVLAIALNPHSNLIWDLPSAVSLGVGLTTLGGLVLVFGFPLGFWLSVATVGVLAFESGRNLRGARTDHDVP